MAEVIVYQDPRYGAAQLWTLPRDPAGTPRTAYIPQGPFGAAQAHVRDKGSAQSWPDWAAVLAETLPYGGGFTTETVPDSLTPQQALSYVRERAADQVLGS